MSQINVEDTYQKLLETSYEQDYNIYLESLCNLDTKWIETGGEKTVRKMYLRHESKIFYQFIKHSPCPIVHNETVNKEDNTKTPKKRARKDKKPKNVKTVEVHVVDNPEKNVQEDNTDEDEKTLNDLMKKFSKDKAGLLAESSVRMQNKENKNVEEEQPSEDGGKDDKEDKEDDQEDK
ncbi:hypothetical protein RYX36_034609 [Vicia faba]